MKKLVCRQAEYGEGRDLRSGRNYKIYDIFDPLAVDFLLINGVLGVPYTFHMLVVIIEEENETVSL